VRTVIRAKREPAIADDLLIRVEEDGWSTIEDLVDLLNGYSKPFCEQGTRNWLSHSQETI
jgi:hypothetical protein